MCQVEGTFPQGKEFEWGSAGPQRRFKDNLFLDDVELRLGLPEKETEDFNPIWGEGSSPLLVMNEPGGVNDWCDRLRRPLLTDLLFTDLKKPAKSFA